MYRWKNLTKTFLKKPCKTAESPTAIFINISAGGQRKSSENKLVLQLFTLISFSKSQPDMIISNLLFLATIHGIYCAIVDHKRRLNDWWLWYYLPWARITANITRDLQEEVGCGSDPNEWHIWPHTLTSHLLVCSMYAVVFVFSRCSHHQSDIKKFKLVFEEWTIFCQYSDLDF